MTMSSFALPPRPQTSGQTRSNNKSNNTTTANPLREHVNVYSVNQNPNGGGGGSGKGAKSRAAGYGGKEDADLLASMAGKGLGLGLKVNYPTKPPTPSPTASPGSTYLAQLPSPRLHPQDVMDFMQLQQAQLSAAGGNPQLQAYLAMQASAQRANLLSQLALQQAQLEALSRPSSTNTTPSVVNLSSPTLPTPSTFMPPPPVPSPRERSTFAQQVQARTKAREAAAAAIAAGGHARTSSVSSAGSTTTAAPAESTSKPPTPVIRITPALPSQPQFGSSLGLGRPSGASPSPRLGSSPALGSSPRLPEAARSVSLPVSTGNGGVRVIRQPNGPPAPAAELGDRNFQSCMRKKAGLKLGVLGRRVEGSSTKA